MSDRTLGSVHPVPFSKRSIANVTAISLSLLVCCSLVFSPLALAKLSTINLQGQSRRGRPEAGPPEATLPNLDQVRPKRHPRPEAPAALPSLRRSHRKPLLPRNGRRVGDPFTEGIGINSDPHTPAMDGRPATDGRPQAVDGASNRGALRIPASSATTRTERLGLRHFRNHSSLRNGTRSPALAPPITDGDYVQRWFTYAFERSANSTELGYWDDLLRAAYAHGQPSIVMASREMGKTLFESADYAARARSNHDYIYDLYKTYLMRSPDSGGWTYWESQVPGLGRENVRRAFDESGEFISKVATVTLTGAASSSVTSLMAARVDLSNQAGNQLLTRDAEWALPLLSLPGRSGLDLGLGISYSSAGVWTRSGPYIYFDDDNSSLSPGFHIGFPTIQEKYFNAEIGQDAFLLITSAGRRVELRQVNATLYQAFDSSYLQLTDNGASLLLRSTDGTQMTYAKIENEWRCTKIKDRNGNYITVSYNLLGDLISIRETVWRLITFNYDGNGNLSSIVQDWNGAAHNLATFGWGTTTVAPGFTGVALSGVANGQSIPVLTMVGLIDGSYYRFAYPTYSETQTGQVTLIKHFASDSNPASDNHKLSEVAFDYASAANDPTPRLTATRVRAVENWTGYNGVPSEITTNYSTATDKSWGKMTLPDGTIYKEFYVTAGWQKRFTTETKIYLSTIAEQSDIWEKRTTTAFTHDGAGGATYPINPRVTETNIYDSSHRRRTKVGDWWSFTLQGGTTCTLPKNVYEYDADATTVLRRSRTDYVQSAAYLDRWIIGLPQAQYVCDGAQGENSCGDTSGASLVSKVTYQYDETGSVEYQGSPVQHDTDYDSLSIPGRANLSSTSRYDVTNLSQFVSNSMVYNTNGSLIRTRHQYQPGIWHESSISYSDSFSADGVNATSLSVVTMAYPTTLTDADGYSSLIKYHYDSGAKTRLQGPPPAGQAQGAIQIFAYDNAARLSRVTTANNGAYTRYVYGPTYIQSYSTVNNPADDTYSIQGFDGLGRVIGAAGNHPGSYGTYKAQLTKYDLMGRVIKQSNPAEINAGWVPVGEDEAGWLYTQQTYDWKGRPLRTTNTDADATHDGTHKDASYSGCGCAGGAVVTLTDEGTLDSGVAKRRQQKIYSDVLGRTVKTEVLNWEGGSPYATAINTYNARDQVTQVRQ